MGLAPDPGGKRSRCPFDCLGKTRTGVSKGHSVTVTTFRFEASETLLHSFSKIFLDCTAARLSTLRKNQEEFLVNARINPEVVTDLHRASDSLRNQNVRMLLGDCSCPLVVTILRQKVGDSYYLLCFIIL